MPLRLFALAALLCAAASAQASCYSVFGAQQQLLWRDGSSPVALDQPLHEALETRFGAGARMVMNSNASGSDCPSFGVPATPARLFEGLERRPQREAIEVGADSWPATEGGKIYPAYHYPAYGGPRHSAWGQRYRR